jgi:hypothetical protein
MDLPENYCEDVDAGTSVQESMGGIRELWNP